MLQANQAVLNIIDVQGKLATLMYHRETLFDNQVRIIKAAHVLGIPILWNEQLPEKLGETVLEIKNALEGYQPLVKKSFSCCGNSDFNEKLITLNRKQVIIAGIETHICVYQTCRDLVRNGYEIYLLADAVSSRTLDNYQVGIDRIKDEGGIITSVEMALFEVMNEAGGASFKEIVKILK